MRSLIKFFILCFFLCCKIYADWDPQMINSNTLNDLNNPTFIAHKANVSKALNGSWCSPEKAQLLMDLMVLIRPQICVEVGAMTGSSVLPVASTLKYLSSGKIIAIDAWSNTEATKFMSSNDPNKAWWATVDMESLHKNFEGLLNEWALQNVCIEMRLPSDIAIFAVPENIDFLHLDGDYSEKGAFRDAELYLPKVKSGGYILLSNLFTMVKKEQPKIKSFVALCDACEIITSIENDNTVLFKKM